MAYRQPRIPEYREKEGAEKTLRALILFLKDFTMAAWTANNQRKREIEAVRSSMPETPEIVYPVTSVNGRAGDVQLSAADVGALGKEEQAADSACFAGNSWAQALLATHPVGSVYISAHETSPAALFGGTWEQIEDTFLLAASGVYSQTQTYAAGDTGGEAEHTLTVGEMPSHTHEWNPNRCGTNYKYKEDCSNAAAASAAGTTNGMNWRGYNLAAGGDGAHNNMPPYLAVYMWKRVS